MTRKTMWILLAVTVWFGSGCLGRAVSEGLGEVKGASGLTMAINPASTRANPSELAGYRRFALGEITDDIGGRLSSQFLPALREEFSKQLLEHKLPNQAGGKTLVIRGKIVHYEDSGMMSNVFGPLEEVICRAEFVDQSSGKVLAVANCIGRTNTSLNLGVKTKAEGLAKAFVSWIDKRYPKEGRPGGS